MTPCFDETAKRHSGQQSLSTCMGLLHLVDGAGRWLGMSFALAVYGAMKDSGALRWFWPVVVASFLLVSGSLHVVCHILGRPSDKGPRRQTHSVGSIPIAAPLRPESAAPV
jgi:hypothetical protein